ncbi:hypothetical protein CDIK_3509 [Cucumispora dikerogammari]|nr:hypothetical protein CDIK_3509 [Cucumispora dikerogammari]
MTEKLIKLKHSDQMNQLFTSAINKPKKMNGCWKRLGEQFDPVVLGDSCKIKYNQLLSKFRQIQTELQRSGADSIHWHYLKFLKIFFQKLQRLKWKVSLSLEMNRFLK